MKKVALFLALIMLFSCLLPLAAHAEEQPKTLLEALVEASTDEREIFSGCGYISHDDALVTAYDYDLWNYHNNKTATSLSELIEMGKEHNASGEYSVNECFVFGENTVKKLLKDEGRAAKFVRLKEYTADDAPEYLLDILNGRASQTICDVKCNVLDVVCFPVDDNSEKVVFFITDQGNFVRIYRGRPHYTTYVMLEMTESDFFTKLASYCKNLKDLDEHLDERYGARESFLSFVEFEGVYVRTNPYDYSAEPEPEQNIFQKYLALWIAIPATLLAHGAIACFVIRKKKKQKPAEE